MTEYSVSETYELREAHLSCRQLVLSGEIHTKVIVRAPYLLRINVPQNVHATLWHKDVCECRFNAVSDNRRDARECALALPDQTLADTVTDLLGDVSTDVLVDKMIAHLHI